jgi:transcriptional regulator with XRE-family HTH domain
MGESMGLSVPKIKATVSQDFNSALGHTVQMTQPTEDTTDIEWQEGLRMRIKQARGARTQEVMADLLGISRDAYSKYEGTRGTVMPPRYYSRFCNICAISLEWLIDGDKAEKAKKVAKEPTKQPKTARRR